MSNDAANLRSAADSQPEPRVGAGGAAGAVGEGAVELAGGGPAGDVADAMLPLVYDELRALAGSRLGREARGGAGLTLQPTALVHEAFLRVVGPDGRRAGERWNSRGHFFGAASQAMRRILIERARHAGRAKHGGGKARVELADAGDVPDDADAAAEAASAEKLLALDAALTRLEQTDPRKAQVVSLRYFGGLSVEATAAALDLSPATVKNEWAFARAWLRREVGGDPD